LDGWALGKIYEYFFANHITNHPSAAIILFFALFFRFVAQLPDNPGTPAHKGKEFVDILIVAVTVIVVAIPGE
jgi:hypothetical protein